MGDINRYRWDNAVKAVVKGKLKFDRYFQNFNVNDLNIIHEHLDITDPVYDNVYNYLDIDEPIDLLTIACVYNKFSTVKVLVEKYGANFENYTGLQVIVEYEAAYKGNFKLFKFIHDNKKTINSDALITGLRSKNIKIAKFILDRYNVNETINGNVPLIAICSSYNILLLDYTLNKFYINFDLRSTNGTNVIKYLKKMIKKNNIYVNVLKEMLYIISKKKIYERINMENIEMNII